MIRRLTKNDFCEVAELSKRTFSDGWSAEMIECSFNQNCFLAWVYEVDGKIVSSIATSYLFDEGEVLFIVTDKEFQRRGIANELLKTALDELSTRGVKEIFLEVRESNLGAIKLYTQNGFKKIAERAKYYGDETALIMLLGL